MKKQWYEMKEQAAGLKRLLLLYFIYRYFGKSAVKFIVFFVTFFAFVFAKDVRGYSKKYLSVIGLKPSLINQFRHFLNYSYSLLDNMEVFTNNFDDSNITFSDEDTHKAFVDDIYAGKGVFFICSHLGNVNILRAFLHSKQYRSDIHVNIFLSKTQSKIFNEFIKKIAVKQNVTTYSVENIGIETSIELKDKFDRGEIAFLAGDRVSETNSGSFQAEFLGKTVEFPKGTFKFAHLMEVPVYFIVAVKENSEKYKIYLQKAPNNLGDMQSQYVKFLEKLTKEYPLQFYHFYDIFVDE